MDFKLGSIHLYSRNKERLIDFLSTLFELDAPEYGDGIKIPRENFSFTIKECDGSQDFSQKENVTVPWLEFSLQSKKELEDLHKRIEFYHYCQGRDDEEDQNDDSGLSWEGEDALNIKDPDGRFWKFSLN